MTLYDEAVAAGIEIDHHESDLYLRDCPEARALIAKHALHADPFISRLDGRPWLDVPFMFAPWWKRADPWGLERRKP